MGFYGKIYEQAINIFNRLKFRNTTADSEQDFPTVSDSFVLTADGGEDSAIFQAGNKWIQFVKNPKEHLQCDVYHAKSAYKPQTTLTFATSKDNTANGTKDNPISIDHGTIITVKYPTTDAAGHITGFQEKVYYLQADLTALWNFVNTLRGDYDQHAIDSAATFQEMSKNIATANEVANNANATAYNASETAKSANKTANDIASTANSAATNASNALAAATNTANALGNGFSATNTVTSNMNNLKAIIGDDSGDLPVTTELKDIKAQQILMNSWISDVNSWIKNQDQDWPF